MPAAALPLLRAPTKPANYQKLLGHKIACIITSKNVRVRHYAAEVRPLRADTESAKASKAALTGMLMQRIYIRSGNEQINMHKLFSVEWVMQHPVFSALYCCRIIIFFSAISLINGEHSSTAIVILYVWEKLIKM